MYLAQSTNWGHFPDRIVLGFEERENRSTRRKSSRSKDENQHQTQPTYDAKSGNRTRATLVGGERSHHCAIPAPLFHKLSYSIFFITLFSIVRLAWEEVWLRGSMLIHVEEMPTVSAKTGTFRFDYEYENEYEYDLIFSSRAFDNHLLSH